MLLKIVLLLVALAIVKQIVFSYTKAERRRYTQKYRPKDPTDTMNYDNVKPITAAIAGKSYAFSSTAEYRYAIHLQKMLEKGEIYCWTYEETMFAFYQKPFGKEWKPDGVHRVIYPSGGMGVSDRALVRAYIPDFCITYNNKAEEYVEVKGRLTQRAKQALENMKIYHPKAMVTVLFTSTDVRFKDTLFTIPQ